LGQPWHHGLRKVLLLQTITVRSSDPTANGFQPKKEFSMPNHMRFSHTPVHFSQTLRALMLCLVIAPAQAGTLTSNTIESFITSLQDMEAIFEDSEEDVPDEEFEDDDMAIDFTRIYSGMVQEVSKHPPTQRKIRVLAKRHGFSSLDEWASAGDRIYTAYMAINMEGQPVMNESEMESYMASLKQLPEDERNNIREMMEGAIESNKTIRNAPREDIKAVRPYIDEITALHMDEE
jgi:hypothetical protein